jgi:predicted unusual protein kinase regulating ubiquinone biosynthesis (AarF/ABC1/UbiB family)
MQIFRYQIRFVRGVALFLRILVGYKVLSLRNAFASPAIRKERLKRLHAQYAFILRERMIEMRGVLIKVGQFLSSRVDILPEEYTTELSKLQDHVPPADITEIMKRVNEEIGSPGDVFASFDETPIASASLGQVHRATLKSGEQIAVKVQYPGIEEVIAADIRTFGFIIRLLKIFYRRINLDVIYSEFSRIIHEELDYIQEGKSAAAFARNFSNNPKIRIPVVYWPFTTSKVLTLEYLEGAKITDFDAIDAQGSTAKRWRASSPRPIVRCSSPTACSMAIPIRQYLCPARPRIVLVDFGMVDRISIPKREGLKRAFTAIVERDSLGLVRALVDMGFIPLTRNLQPLVQFVDRIFAKYRDMSPGEFKAMDIEEIGDDIMEALRLSPSIQIPNDFILLGRVAGMLNGLGSQLDPDTNIIEIATPFAKRFIMAEEMSAAALFGKAGVTARALVSLPKLLSDFLVSTGRNEARIEITSRDIMGELITMSRIGKGMILAFLTVGAGLAAVIFRINHFNTESAWLAALCVVFCIRIFMLIRRSRRRSPAVHPPDFSFKILALSAILAIMSSSCESCLSGHLRSFTSLLLNDSSVASLLQNDNVKVQSLP